MNCQEVDETDLKDRDNDEVFGLNCGRSWSRAEDRLEKKKVEERFEKGNWRGVRDGQKKRVKNDNGLKQKLKKTLQNSNMVEDEHVTLIPSFEREKDTDILNRREKQISYGKNMPDYDKYSELIKRSERKNEMPRTPNKNKKYSRRQWDGLVKNWKQQIHVTVDALKELNEETESPVDSEDWNLDGHYGSTESWEEEEDIGNTKDLDTKDTKEMDTKDTKRVDTKELDFKETKELDYEYTKDVDSRDTKELDFKDTKELDTENTKELDYKYTKDVDSKDTKHLETIGTKEVDKELFCVGKLTDKGSYLKSRNILLVFLGLAVLIFSSVIVTEG